MPVTSARHSWAERLAARDPGGLALLRGIRTAIVGPLVFTFSVAVLDNDAVALCAVFGGCAALLFADFGGTHRSRNAAYFLLGIGGALLLGLGTWVSASPIPTVILTFAVVATVRFLANLGPRWSAAMSPTILLRSCAFATGRSAVSAAVGTAVGFGAAALAFAVVGLDQPVFWVLLVVGFFGAGYLPQVSGIQAAFTVAVSALFNIVEPSGWEIGHVRLENVGL